MKVIVAGSAGFCWGVSRAVSKARDVARRTGRLVHTDGPLIHNEQMMARLRTEGVCEAVDLAKVAGDILLIRAHGIPPERRQMLRGLRAEVVDCTCPDVARIQGLIRKHARKGCAVVIFGDAGHAEVIGLLGHAESRGHVVGGPRDVEALPELAKVCLVAQSTQFPAAYEAVAEAVRRRFRDVTVLDTICESTRRRQEDLLKIAEEADAVVVVGGAHSANTLRLVELARSLKPTVHIQTADQLQAELFRGVKTVGLTAGASTPDFIIEAVRRKLEDM